MATLTIQEAQAQLADLIHRLVPGDKVVITENVDCSPFLGPGIMGIIGPFVQLMQPLPGSHR